MVSPPSATHEKTRTDLLTVIAELSRLRPEWRLGQLLSNVAMTAGRMDAGGVWDLEDEEAVASVRELLIQYAHDQRVNA